MLVVFAWGFEYPLITRTAPVAGFLVTGAVSFGVSTLLLGAWIVLVARVPGTTRRPPPALGQWSGLFSIGAVSLAINALALLAAETTTTVNLASLARTDVLFSLGLSALVFHEKFEKSSLAFAPLMLAGTALLMGLLTEAPELGHPGDFYVLASAFLVSLNAFMIKRSVQVISGLWIGFVNSAANTAGFLVACLIFGPAWEDMRVLPRETWNELLILGCLVFLFFATYNSALRTIPVWKVRLTCLAAPVIGTLAGWVVFRDPAPSSVEWLGMGLICSGAAGLILVRKGSASGKV